MPKQNRLKLSDEIERTLEEKITRKTQASVQQLVEQELNTIWENKFHAKCIALIAEQFESIKLEIAKNRKDISLLTEIRVSNRTVNPNEPLHFGEPEPNLNQQNFTSVNLNQT